MSTEAKVAAKSRELVKASRAVDAAFAALAVALRRRKTLAEDLRSMGHGPVRLLMPEGPLRAAYAAGLADLMRLPPGGRHRSLSMEKQDGPAVLRPATKGAAA